MMRRPAWASCLQRTSVAAMGLAVALAAGIVALTVLAATFATGLLAQQTAARVQARVMADSLSAAVALQDVMLAQASLQSLARTPDVLAAQPVLRNGAVIGWFSVALRQC